MQLTLKTLFASGIVTIRHAIARPSPAPCSEVMHGEADQLLMPIAGVFAKHESPDEHIIANSNHALFFGYGKPYRISFPDGVGDESLVLRFSDEALSGLLIETAGVDALHSPHLQTHCLLPPLTVLDRDLLWRCLTHRPVTPLVVEELSMTLLARSIRAARRDTPANDHRRHATTALRRRRQVETVKELISLHPGKAWTLDVLAREANTSPYHLARIFREDVGVPVYQYLIRVRLGKALEKMRAANGALTDIALEAGFSTHSHFSSSFRSLFGISPSQLRNHTRQCHLTHVR